MRVASFLRVTALAAGALVATAPLASQDATPRRLKVADTGLPGIDPRAVAPGAARGHRRPFASARPRGGAGAVGRRACPGEVPRSRARRSGGDRPVRRCRGGGAPLPGPRRRRVRAGRLPRALRFPPQRSAVRQPVEPERPQHGTGLGRQPRRDERGDRGGARRRPGLRHRDLPVQRARRVGRHAPLPGAGPGDDSLRRGAGADRAQPLRRAARLHLGRRRPGRSRRARHARRRHHRPAHEQRHRRCRHGLQRAAHAGEGDRRRLGLHLRRPERGDDVGRGARASATPSTTAPRSST